MKPILICLSFAGLLLTIVITAADGQDGPESVDFIAEPVFPDSAPVLQQSANQPQVAEFDVVNDGLSDSNAPRPETPQESAKPQPARIPLESGNHVVDEPPAPRATRQDDPFDAADAFSDLPATVGVPQALSPMDPFSVPAAPAPMTPPGWFSSYPGTSRGRTPEIQQLESQVRGAIAQLQADIRSGEYTEPPTDRLKDLLVRLFDAHGRLRKERVDELQQRVERLRRQLNERTQARDQIVELRLQLLVNQAQGLTF